MRQYGTLQLNVIICIYLLFSDVVRTLNSYKVLTVMILSEKWIQKGVDGSGLEQI
jgi:hypothetical protein